MALSFTTSYLEDSLSLFREYKRLAERAMEQVPDERPLHASSMCRKSNLHRCHREAHGRQYAFALAEFPRGRRREDEP